LTEPNQQISQAKPARCTIKDESVSAGALYAEMVVGSSSVWAFLVYELVTVLCSRMPGAIGYVLRRVCYRWILGGMGKDVTIGCGVVLRGAARITLGDSVFIDDNCVLDARGPESSITISNHVIISRGTVIRTRGGALDIGSSCDIGCNCILATDTRLHMGEKVLVGAYSYLVGGGNHEYRNAEQPIMEQPSESKGGIRIGDDVWIGSRVTVMDGVDIGSGSVIGAHSLVRHSLPERAIAYGTPARVTGSR